LDDDGEGEMQKMLSQQATKTDEELVRDAQQGNEASFTELMRRHSRASFKLAVSMLKDPHEAEDEVQNAYWKAYQYIGQFECQAKFSTWMTRIVMNQCLMRLRQLRRSKFVYLDDALIGEDRGTLELPDPAENPEEALERKQMTHLLEREIRRIPPLLRHALVLREVSELPMPEVAEQLGISVAAAKSRLLRARHELRNRLDKYCGDIGPAALTA
jgi:RNA polymerase sigma-70 factor, ECF subfamily